MLDEHTVRCISLESKTARTSCGGLLEIATLIWLQLFPFLVARDYFRVDFRATHLNKSLQLTDVDEFWK